MFEQLPKPPKPTENVKTGRSPIDRVGAALSTALWEHAGDPDAPMPYRKLLDANATPFERVKSLFAIVRDVVPDPVFEKLTNGRYHHDASGLPFDPAQYEFDSRKVGSGSECNVYRLISLDPGAPSLVIKIDNGIRRDVDVLIERGKELQSEHAEMREWYKDLPEFIPDELQFIAKSPTGGRNALFTVQQFLGTKDQIHDLIRGQSREALIELLRRDAQARADFLIFASVTLEKAEMNGETIDTLGDRNIVLIDQADGSRALRYLDPHGKYRLSEVSEHKRQLLRADLDFLREVSQVLKETETAK